MMKTQARLIAATVVLTVMIWVYADLSSHEIQRIPLSVVLTVPGQSDLQIELEGSSAGMAGLAMVELPAKMSGSKAALREIELDRQRSASRSLRIEIPVKDTVGEDTIRPEELRDYVSEWARQHSLTLVDPIRQSLSYRVDRWMQVPVVIEVDAGVFSEELKEPPTVDPPRVMVELLASRLPRVDGTTRRLIISIVDELRRHPEEEAAFDVPLGQQWEGIDGVRFSPEQVRITARRQEGSRRQRLTAIPLHEMWPSNRPPGQYRIAWPDDLGLVQHIDVLVPAGKPRALLNTDVIAYVTVDPEDFPVEPSTGAPQTAPAVERSGIPRDVRFVFPPGFEDVRIVPPTPKVRFNVVRIDAAQPAR